MDWAALINGIILLAITTATGIAIKLVNNVCNQLSMMRKQNAHTQAELGIVKMQLGALQERLNDLFKIMQHKEEGR